MSRAWAAADGGVKRHPSSVAMEQQRSGIEWACVGGRSIQAGLHRQTERQRTGQAQQGHPAGRQRHRHRHGHDTLRLVRLVGVAAAAGLGLKAVQPLAQAGERYARQRRHRRRLPWGKQALRART